MREERFSLGIVSEITDTMSVINNQSRMKNNTWAKLAKFYLPLLTLQK